MQDGEVRNLSLQSVSAAKEIKTLITASVTQVTAGSEQIQMAGAIINQIVNSIRSVTDTMQKIISASKEQRSGTEQVNDALG